MKTKKIKKYFHTKKRSYIRKHRSNRVLKGGSNVVPSDIKFAVMGIFKNEAMGIKEWVDHYKWQGADEIVLLDNESTDGGGDLVRNLEHVTVISAPGKHSQVSHYTNLGLPKLKEKKMDVVAVVDLDEFMFGTDGKNLKQHVVEIFGASPRPSKFSCNWIMFGSSGLDKQPESIRKSFTWRAKNKDGNIKSVMWINDITGNVDLHDTAVNGTTVQCPAGIQLNHYAIQSKEYFEKVKMKRGNALNPQSNGVRTWDYFKSYNAHNIENTQLKNLVNGQSGGNKNNNIK